LKHIIITGGTGGIGSEITKSLIKENYFLSIIGRNEKSYSILLNEIIDHSKIEFIKADISNNKEVKDLFLSINKLNHNLYGLVNIAAEQSPIGPFSSSNLSDWKKNISNNLFGTANMCYEFINHKKLNRGKIINFSGGGATFPRANFSAYSISKIGTVKLTEILAKELTNIDINIIAPGEINTKMLDEVIEAGEKAGNEYIESIKRKRDGGDSISNTIDLCIFLLSQKSNKISGKLISAVWDDFNNNNFINKLKNDSDFCTLRRIDLKNFQSLI
jgi:NAD(P)-dependent dehydrogenase (short-subunit alcohol dehydrogenase family)